MNAAALWLRDFPTHGLLSFKTDRSLPPFNAEESWPRKKKRRHVTSDRCPAWNCAALRPALSACMANSETRRFLSSQICTRACELRFYPGKPPTPNPIAPHPTPPTPGATLHLQRQTNRFPQSSRQMKRDTATGMYLDVWVCELHICPHDVQIYRNTYFIYVLIHSFSQMGMRRPHLSIVVGVC